MTPRRRKLPWTGAALLAFALACGGSDERRPNLLLVSIDTLRADHVSSYGYERATTPAIDRLAAEGVRFENAIVQRGATWPSMTSILTSMYPHSHGVRGQGVELDASVRSIAEYLSDAGYRTAAFLTNMTSAEHRGFELQQGWGHAHIDPERRARADERATAAGRRWLREHGHEPFFVWVHLLGPHDPYEPDPPRPRRFDTGYRGELDGARMTTWKIHRQKRALAADELAHIVSLYDEEVAAVDTYVAELLAELDAAGLRDDTLVVLTGDHGEELYEHDFYFFHALSIHGAVLRVPLVMRFPGRLPAGREVAAIVESIDIAPTLFGLLGLPRPESFEGANLEALIADPETADPEAQVAFSELGVGVFSLRTDRWHYIYNPREFSSPGVIESDVGQRGWFSIETEELYDLRADPRETHNLAAARPELASSLRSRLNAWRQPHPSPAKPARLSDDVRAELRALGYLDEEEPEGSALAD